MLANIVERGYVVVNVNYALAPEYQYPTPLIQMDKAVAFIKANQNKLPVDMNQVVLVVILLALKLTVNLLRYKPMPN